MDCSKTVITLLLVYLITFGQVDEVICRGLRGGIGRPIISIFKGRTSGNKSSTMKGSDDAKKSSSTMEGASTGDKTTAIKGNSSNNRSKTKIGNGKGFYTTDARPSLQFIFLICIVVIFGGAAIIFIVKFFFNHYCEKDEEEYWLDESGNKKNKYHSDVPLIQHTVECEQTGLDLQMDEKYTDNNMYDKCIIKRQHSVAESMEQFDVNNKQSYCPHIQHLLYPNITHNVPMYQQLHDITQITATNNQSTLQRPTSVDISHCVLEVNQDIICPECPPSYRDAVKKPRSYSV